MDKIEKVRERLIAENFNDQETVEYIKNANQQQLLDMAFVAFNETADELL